MQDDWSVSYHEFFHSKQDVTGKVNPSDFTYILQDYLEQNKQTDGFLVGHDFATLVDSEWDWYEKYLGVADLLSTLK